LLKKTTREMSTGAVALKRPRGPGFKLKYCEDTGSNGKANKWDGLHSLTRGTRERKRKDGKGGGNGAGGDTRHILEALKKRRKAGIRSVGGMDRAKIKTFEKTLTIENTFWGRKKN